MPATQKPVLDEAIAALIRGAHRDPFAVLGPHADESGTILVRAFQPAARSIELRVVATGALLPMTKRGPEGVFEIRIERVRLKPPFDVAQGGPEALEGPDTTDWVTTDEVTADSVVSGSSRTDDEVTADSVVSGFSRTEIGPDYRLRITYPADHVVELDDPYRYGRVLTDFDLHLLGEGTHYRAFEKLGAHRRTIETTTGVHFAVWAPNADRVSVIGDFNGWDGRVHPMRLLAPAGIWEIFVPDLPDGEKYKFEIRTRTGAILKKTDPFARAFEAPPQSAAIVHDISRYEWRDQAWMSSRPGREAWLDRPMATYEVHLGSWARVPEEGNRFLTYREMAHRLVPYAKEMGFTHLELMPVMEHPFSGSWGYQVLGFFAPTARFGPPEDFKLFVDACHQAGLAVILDWVPGHFPKDAHGLAQFDGTALFEHEDPREGEHQDWGTLIFNYGRNEVRSFLLSNALFWLEEYHVDGLRVDAVASMIYRDYSRKDGQWIPNQFGGRENIEAISFLQQLNSLTHGEHPGTITAAEESTSWPGVTRPVYLGGLGFTYKWNMGWMHDILQYAHEDPIHRRWHHNLVTFSALYMHSENFILPFSHDEIVHGKGSMLEKMPGDVWQKCASLRTFYGYMYGHPGKKLLFMGSEFGQWREWNHDRSLDWHLLDDPAHAALRLYVQDLNRFYRAEPALYRRDFDPSGFRWIDCNDNENSVVSFVRYGHDHRDFVVMVFNFTPVPRAEYRIGVPEAGGYAELLNSDASMYGGSNVGNLGRVTTEPVAAHGFDQSLRLMVPPLGCLLLKKRG